MFQWLAGRSVVHFIVQSSATSRLDAPHTSQSSRNFSLEGMTAKASLCTAIYHCPTYSRSPTNPVMFRNKALVSYSTIPFKNYIIRLRGPRILESEYQSGCYSHSTRKNRKKPLHFLDQCDLRRDGHDGFEIRTKCLMMVQISAENCSDAIVQELVCIGKNTVHHNNTAVRFEPNTQEFVTSLVHSPTLSCAPRSTRSDSFIHMYYRRYKQKKFTTAASLKKLLKCPSTAPNGFEPTAARYL